MFPTSSGLRGHGYLPGQEGTCMVRERTDEPPYRTPRAPAESRVAPAASASRSAAFPA